MNPALVISARDNVATALEMLEPGRTLDLGARHVVVRDRIPPGHKVAIEPIASGHEVVKYGSAIGTAMTEIAVVAHVHTHNVASSRGRGDLGALGALGASGALGATGASGAPNAPNAPNHPLAEPEG